MTTYTDLYSTMNIQDGMEADPNHANNFQRFLRAQMTDQALEKLIPFIAASTGSFPSKQFELTGQGGANASTLYAYAMHPGSAYLIQGGANNVFGIQAGTLLQKVANADGSDSSLVAFTFTGTETWPAIANGATNYRIDLLQMQLSYITDTPASVDFQDAMTRALTTNPITATRRRVRASLTIKQGTPAASPVVPEPDAGFVPVAFVCVGAGWTSATAPQFGFEAVASPTTQAIVYDLRMPLGVQLHRVDPVLFKLQTAWALSNQNQTLTSSSATNNMYAMAQTGPGRLIGVMIENTGVGAVFPGSFGLLKLSAATPSANYVAANNMVGGTGGQSFITRIYRKDFEQMHIPMGTGPTIQASVTNLYGPPLWSNGYRAMQEPGPATGGPPTGAAWGAVAAGWVNSASGVTIGGIWFVFATGL